MTKKALEAECQKHWLRYRKEKERADLLEIEIKNLKQQIQQTENIKNIADMQLVKVEAKFNMLKRMFRKQIIKAAEYSDFGEFAKREADEFLKSL